MKTREQIEERMAPVREAAPELWAYVERVIDEAWETGRYGRVDPA